MVFRRLRCEIAILLGLFAPRAEANRFLDNPEFAVDRVREAWTAPIGELEATRTEEAHRDFGTGFLVSPCYVLTAHHVVYGNDLTPLASTDYRMKFRAGTSITAAFAGNTTATPVTSGFRDDNGHDDWALLRLTNCIGKRPEIGWFETSDTRFSNRLDHRSAPEAVNLGYATDTNRGILPAGRGKLTYQEPSSGLRIFTGLMKSGESGGPVMILENGILTVHAMNQGTSPSGVSKVQSIYEVVNRPNVKAMLDQDKAAWGLPNPNLPRLRMSHLPQPK